MDWVYSIAIGVAIVAAFVGVVILALSDAADRVAEYVMLAMFIAFPVAVLGWLAYLIHERWF